MILVTPSLDKNIIRMKKKLRGKHSPTGPYQRKRLIKKRKAEFSPKDPSEPDKVGKPNEKKINQIDGQGVTARRFDSCENSEQKKC